MSQMTAQDVEIVSGGLVMVPWGRVARFVGEQAAAWGLDQAFDYEAGHIGSQVSAVSSGIAQYQNNTGGLWAYGY